MKARQHRLCPKGAEVKPKPKEPERVLPAETANRVPVTDKDTNLIDACIALLGLAAIIQIWAAPTFPDITILTPAAGLLYAMGFSVLGIEMGGRFRLSQTSKPPVAIRTVASIATAAACFVLAFCVLQAMWYFISGFFTLLLSSLNIDYPSSTWEPPLVTYMVACLLLTLGKGFSGKVKGEDATHG